MSDELKDFLEGVTPQDETWWWLSFCDSSQSTGQHLLGVALVRGTCHADAVSRAWQLGCNPGGECMGHPVPIDMGDPPEAMRNKLVADKAEIERLTEEWTGDGCMTAGEAEVAGLL
ncbi:MAG: hypothetical protein EHM89_00310 [Acidobacteria bacterium]|nr:MAG: hypothetical protein EHM89_00310 [Acidobacteriota bacterium]